jgi:ATP-binding cassette, subfamily B, bacterial PglK
MKETPQSFINIFREIVGRFPGKRKKQFWGLLVCMMLVSLFETVTVGAIAFFMTAIASPEGVLQSGKITRVREILGIEFLGTIQGLVVSVSVLVVIMMVLKNGLQSLVLFWTTRFGAQLDAFFGDKLFNGFLKMPYEWHLSHNTADLILAVDWRSYIGHSFLNNCFTIMGDTLLVLLMLSTLFLVQPATSVLILLLAGGTAYYVYRKMHALQRKMSERCMQYSLTLNRHVTKGIHGIKDVKVSGQDSFAEDFEKEAYSHAISQGFRNLFATLPVRIMEIIGFVMLTSTICLMLFFMNSSTTKITATISLLVVVSWRILPAISRILSSFTGFRSMAPFIQTEIEYIKEIESNSNHQRVAGPMAVVDFPFTDEIRFEKVSFGYKARAGYVLEDISFLIKKGQTTGFIGCSGAGKSTLVDTLIGLLVPSVGKVLVDGRELDDMGRLAWMRTVGYVPQSPYIYDGTLAGNIAFGLSESEIDRELVLECCHKASMQDILDNLPQGIDTPIGERGVRLSGGQQQRVVIARALYPRPEVMIFDEATSSLDAKSEKAIQNTIYGLRGNQTLIIIAHRLATVKECDFLVWIENGKAKMIGTPAEVLDKYENSLHNNAL